MNKTPKSIWVALVSALAAVGVHGYLTIHHYKLVLGIADGKGFCNMTELMDCDAVNTSQYSEFWGIPLALWGAAFNALLAIFILWHLLLKSPRLAKYALYLSVFIAGVSIVMAPISYLKIGLVCLFCTSAYLLSFVAAISLFLYNRPGPFSNLRDDLLSLANRGTEKAFSVLVVSFIITVAGVFVTNDMTMKSYGTDLKWVISDSISSWRTNPEVKFNDQTGLVKGATAEQARMTLVEYADFRCPHCKNAVPSLHSFVKSHPDVRLIFMNFPLDSGCNPAMQRPGESCPLAKSIYCANKEGKGWQAHDWLFENQGKVNSSDLSDLISHLKVDETSFKACLASSETHEVILAQAKSGSEAKVEGTPSVFANGKLLPAGFLIPVLQAVYDEIKN
jgi:protein-disulfide isomerase/uncharacterized membrane protein